MMIPSSLGSSTSSDFPLELQLIDWLSREFGSHAALKRGIGDDGAILQSFGGDEAVITHDTLIDGVHFLFDHKNEQNDGAIGSASAAQIGYKSVAVNLSDLAAMAANPVAIIVGIVLPRGTGIETTKVIFLGMKPLLQQFDIALAGGDTNSSNGPLTIGITAIGTVSSRVAPDNSGNWSRSSARVGDQILVTGELGGSILGKHLSFMPRVREALSLRKRHTINAAIDISDGLLLDLDRICKASNCGAEIDLASIPVSEAAIQISKPQELVVGIDLQKSKSPLAHALTDGEDFELLLTVSAETWNEIQSDPEIDFGLTRIGEIVSDEGISGIDANNQRTKLEPTGFVHDF